MTPSDVASEQRYVDLLYARLDLLRLRAETELAGVRMAGATGTPQARSERDAFATLYESRLVQLRGVEDRLCFGRLDMRDDAHRYIGRLGLFDDDQIQLLVDWRAPAAREFYQATAANPGDVVRRRHLETKGRQVTAVYDDVLSVDDVDGSSRAPTGTLTGDAVLLAALNASRTGRMGDIVATIQSEQDQIIRAPLPGVMVVQGGPGTGKTAVALHRAAYLLYTHRERLASRGVLLVGPSSVFLRYISQVLPSLGETGVVTATPRQLYPGVIAAGDDSSDAAVLKGDLRMVDVLSTAVRARQRVPTTPQIIRFEGATLTLRPRAVASAIESARRTQRPHNVARVTFVRAMLDHLAELVARATKSTFDADDRADVKDGLRDSVDVRRELNLAWPPLEPERFLRDLFASPTRVYEATPGFSNDERELLLRDRAGVWTLADVPLLDETAELLGIDESAGQAAAAQQARMAEDDVKYARQVLRGMGGQASQMVSADTLADRFATSDQTASVADAAFDDRTWAFGHIIVDEAQELSSMMWRLLRRRCPSGSMTLVGDIAQTSSDAGATTWEETLRPQFSDRWERRELTVNYRTPAQIMHIASSMLKAAGIEASIPQSVRTTDVPPQLLFVEADMRAALASLVTSELAAIGQGRVAVITANDVHQELADHVRAIYLLDGTQSGDDEIAIDFQVAVLTVDQAKGLEFDSVIVVEPRDIVGASSRGPQSLYVALTRATQRLAVLHAKELPPGLA